MNIIKADAIKEAHKWEDRVSQLYKRNGYCILETFKFSKNDTEAPMLTVPNEMDCLIVPDLIIFGDEGVRWVEIKTKANSIGGGYTGFEIEKYLNYVRLKTLTKISVDFIFIQKDEKAAYRVSLSSLMKMNHKIFKKSNIIAWPVKGMEKIAELTEGNDMDGTVRYRRESDTVNMARLTGRFNANI